MEGHAGKFHQEIAEFHCLPRSLDLSLQRCCVGYSLPWTPCHPLLSRNFRKTFAKSPLQINRKIHTLNRGWGSAPFDYNIVSAWVYSLPANNNSESFRFT
jgi:hypothetical protein